MHRPDKTRQRNFVVGLILVGLIIVGFFGLRVLYVFRELRGQRPPPPFTGQRVETDVSLLRDWMTIPFIAKMYQVPPHLLFEALGIQPEGNHEKSLKQLNAEYFPHSPGLVQEKIRAALLEHVPPLMPTSPSVPRP